MSRSMLRIRRRLVLSGFLFSVIFACATGPVINEGITLAFLVNDSWDYGYSSENDVQMVYEYVRPGQTVDNWTELATVQNFNKRHFPLSVEEHLDNYRSGLSETCPGSTVKTIRQMPDGVIVEAEIVNCEEGPDEQVLIRLLDGDYNRFTVTFSVRGEMKMTAERRSLWLEHLMALDVEQF